MTVVGEAWVVIQPRLLGFAAVGAKMRAELAGVGQAGAASGAQLGAGVRRGAAEAETGIRRLTARVGELGRVSLLSGNQAKVLLGVLGGFVVFKGFEKMISDAKEFQFRLVDLATGAGESFGNLDMVSEGLRKMSGEVGISALNLEKALYTIESDGFHGAAGLNILRAAAEGARTGLADATVVAQSIMTVMRSYEIPAKDAAAATSMLVTAVAHGGVRMNEMAHGMKVLAPLSAAVHIPIS